MAEEPGALAIGTPLVAAQAHYPLGRGVRIAIYHNLPSGGGKRALHEMTRRLATRHEIDVYTLSTADHAFCDLRAHCARHVVFPFRPLPLARRPFGRLNQALRAADLLRLEAVQRRIAAVVDRHGYDVLFSHNCRFGQSPGVIKFLHTPSVYYCQEPPRLALEPTEPRPYRSPTRTQHLRNRLDPLPAIYRRTLLRLDRANAMAARIVLVNSHYSRETFYRVYGCFAYVAALGIDAGRFRPLSLSRGCQILSVGALTPKKGFDLVIRSLALIDVMPRPALTVISNYVNPLELHYLTNLAASLGVEIEFRSGVSDDELIEAYNQSLLTIYAPTMEPFGFVPLESMACGTAVVGVNEAGVRESVRHGETGLLVERDPEAFATAISDLLRDDERRERMGRQGRRHVEEQWSWDQSVDRIESYLIRAAEGCQ